MPHLRRETFQEDWFTKHAPLVARHREVPRIRRFVQLYSADPTVSPKATAAGRELIEDEKRFSALARSPLWWGEESFIVG